MSDTPRPGMVKAIRADGTVGWVDLHEMMDINITEQLFNSCGQASTGVFGCTGDGDDPEFHVVDEQPSLPLEEMEKAWGDTPCLKQTMKEAVEHYIDMLKVHRGTIPWIEATVKGRGPQEIDAGFFYCPYIPKLNPNKITFVHDGGPLIDPAAIDHFAKIYPIEGPADAPVPKKRKVLSSR